MIYLYKKIREIVYRNIVRILRLFQNISSKSFACTIQNYFSLLTNSSAKFRYCSEDNMYLAYSDHSKRFFKHQVRGFNLYHRGLKKRGEYIFNSYCLNHIKFGENDIVIDCGANYGDLFLELSKYIKEENYITFEPSLSEFKCIEKSLPLANNFQVGLSDRPGELMFYLSSNEGDSSFIKPQSYTHTISSEVTTLDIFKKKENLKSCKLLKLEAEGYEPEILDGAISFLTICDYVAVDGGPERYGQPTFQAGDNQLNESGFKLIDRFKSKHRALYKNTARIN